MLLRPRQTTFVERAVAALRDRGNTLAVAPTGFSQFPVPRSQALGTATVTK